MGRHFNMKKVLCVFLVGLMCIFVAGWGYLQTSHAQKAILSFLTEIIHEKTGHEVEIEELAFPLPFNWVAYKVKIKHNQSIWLTIDEIKLSIPYWRLLSKTFALRAVSLNHVHLLDYPPPSLNSPADKPKLSWKIFPYNVHFADLSIENLTIDTHLLPPEFPTQLFPLDLSGSLTFRPQNHIAHVNLSLKKEALNQEGMRLNLSCQGSSHFTYHLDLLAPKQSLLFQWLGLELAHDAALELGGTLTADQSYQGQFKCSAIEDIKIIESTSEDIFGKYVYHPDGWLNVHSVAGHIGPLQVEGELLLNTSTFQIEAGKLKGVVAHLSRWKNPLDFPIEGSMQFISSFAGTVINPIIELKVSTDHLKVGNESLEDVEGQFTFIKTNKQALKGQLFLSFIYNQLKFKIDNPWQWNEQQIHLKDIYAEYGNEKLTGNLHYKLETKTLIGHLEASIKNSYLLQKYLNIDLLTSSNLSLKFYDTSPSEDKKELQNMDFAWQVGKARYDNFYLEEAIFSGNITNAFSLPQADLHLKATKAYSSSGALIGLNAETKVEMTKDYWPFRISIQEDEESILAAQAHGFWKLNSEELAVKIELFQGQLKKKPFHLQKAFTFTRYNNFFELSPLSLRIGTGHLFFTLEHQKENAYAAARFQFQDLPAELFYPLHLQAPLVGYLQGEIDLLGNPENLKGHLRAHLSQIRLADDPLDSPTSLEARIVGTILENHMAASAQIIGLTQKPIEIDARLPIHLSINPLDIQINEYDSLLVHLAAEGEISPFLPLFEIESSSISGHTSIALDVTGSINDLHTRGDIIIKDGSFESPTTGAAFHHLNAKIEANNKILTLQEFEAFDMNEGAIRGSGRLELKKELAFPFTLNLQLAHIKLLNLDFAKALASGEAIIKGNARQAKVTGHLTTDSLQITIPEQAPALAYSVDVRYINVPEGETSPLLNSSQPAWPVELDMQIDIAPNTAIKSKALASLWQGGIKVKGTPQAPQLFGDVKIIEGDYNFNGKTFDIKEGTISFAGEPDKKTNLYVIASKDLGKMVAEVILKGSVKNPSIAFRSNPPMSQREILSWILFGRGVTDITPFQGAELSQSISNLSKEGNKGPDVLTRIRDSIGLDRIDINKSEGEESNEVSIQVGKYISRGVFVSLNKSITSEVNEISVEANLWRNIKARAQVGDDSSAQLQLKWKRDY
ncbi:hypothetical protein NEOC84_001206|nr:hypothetical protein [Neochlamydia sp. AcF84]